MNTRQRRLRGTAAERPALYARVDHSCKAKVERVADALGISQAQALELLLLHVEVDANGRPPWYDGPLATEEQEELPIGHLAATG